MKTMTARYLVPSLAAAAVSAAAFSADAATIFSESFENPAVAGSTSSGNIGPGAVSLDNPATAAGTVNGEGAVARVVDGGSAGSPAATDGDQVVIYGFGGAAATSLTWEIAAANTLVQGSTLTVTYDVVSLFAPATGETWDVIFSGGASGTQSFSLSDSDTVDVWRTTDSYQVTVADNTQAINLEIVATRASSASDDFAFDNIVVDGTPIPEPSSLALLAVGGCFMLRRRK